jgi:hypothetical protein
MQQDTNGGEVFDTYGRQIGVVGDRSGAVRLDLGLTDRMLTPELWDELDRKVRATFRPELLTADLVEAYEDVPLARARELLGDRLPDDSVTSVLAEARRLPGEPAELVQGAEFAVSVTYGGKTRKYTVVFAVAA